MAQDDILFLLNSEHVNYNIKRMRQNQIGQKQTKKPGYKIKMLSRNAVEQKLRMFPGNISLKLCSSDLGLQTAQGTYPVP